MLPSRVYLHFFLPIGTPQRVPRLPTRFTKFIECACLLFIEIVVYLILANDTPQSVSTCYFGEWYPAECTASLRVIFPFLQMILQRVCLNVILANDTPQRVSIRHFGGWYSAECTAKSPESYNILYAPSTAFYVTLSILSSLLLAIGIP